MAKLTKKQKAQQGTVETTRLYALGEAIELVKQYLAENEPDKTYSVFEDSVDKTIMALPSTGDEEAPMTLVYIVYTNNPDSSVEGNDLPYLAHYVTRSGSYMFNAPVSTRGSEAAKTGGDPLSEFEGMTGDVYTGSVTQFDGSKREITVPVPRHALQR